MLVLYLEYKGNRSEDKIVFDKIKKVWSESWVKDKISLIKKAQSFCYTSEYYQNMLVANQDTKERITIENGQRYFVVHTWLKREGVNKK